MKSKIRSYLNKKKENELYSTMFYKYKDSLANGFSEEESYNKVISIVDGCKKSGKI